MINIQDIAFVRYQANDLDQMEAFLVAFGLRRAARTENALYMRCNGTAHHVHITETSSVGVSGFGLRALSATDLDHAAAELGTLVEDSPEPGGGKRVRFIDPAGFHVDLIHGQQEVEPIAARAPIAGNAHGSARRLGNPIRLVPGPAHVMRLDHALMLVPDLPSWMDFYTRMFGFKPSDTYFGGSPENTVACFLHCGLGKTWTDHHTLAAAASPDGTARIDHSAFEVLDLDDLVQGGEYLMQSKYHRSWGIGRHIQGSQIFDYWRDPFGNKIEHWTDGDLVNDDTPTGNAPMAPGELAQWGPPLNPEFFD